MIQHLVSQPSQSAIKYIIKFFMFLSLTALFSLKKKILPKQWNQRYYLIDKNILVRYVTLSHFPEPVWRNHSLVIINYSQQPWGHSLRSSKVLKKLLICWGKCYHILCTCDCVDKVLCHSGFSCLKMDKKRNRKAMLLICNSVWFLQIRACASCKYQMKSGHKWQQLLPKNRFSQ